MRLFSYLRQWRRVANEAMQFSVSTAKFFGLLHVTDSYLFSTTLAHGPSMLPTFNSSGDVVLAERVSHRFGRVVPGDVVIVRSHNNPKMKVAKRLLGMEGDKVTFVDPNSIRRHRKTTVVPKGHVWIQGDNTKDSFDSRSYGPVPYGLIQGRAFFRSFEFYGWSEIEEFFRLMRPWEWMTFGIECVFDRLYGLWYGRLMALDLWMTEHNEDYIVQDSGPVPKGWSANIHTKTLY